MKKISLCLAGIRPQFWHDLYKSALISCSRHSFEFVIVSPYPLPEELKQYDNIKHIIDWGSPVRATQIGTLAGDAELTTQPCDDGLFIENGLNEAIDLFDSIGRYNDGIVMRYKEGPGMNAPSFPIEYWNPEYHFDINPYQIERGWKIAPQLMLSLQYFKELGGFDCVNLNCCAFALHDISYRMQKEGSVFHLSPMEVMNADNYGAHGGGTTYEESHTPIHVAQTTHDQPFFFAMYSRQSPPIRTRIDLDNWKLAPERWTYRWRN